MRKILFLLSFAIIIGIAPLAFGYELLINEFLASNDTCYADEFGEFDDWVEIYNAGSEPIDMGGMYFTDDLSDPAAWQIPTSDPELTTIEPLGFLLFWFDKDPEQGILHINLKLSAGGEQIGLFESDGTTVIDSITFGEQTTDVSMGRYLDGDDMWTFFETPTPGETNNTIISITDNNFVMVNKKFELYQNYPNPFNPITNISFSIENEANVRLSIYDISGKLIKILVDERKAPGFYSVLWEGSKENGLEAPSGIYISRLNINGNAKTRKMILAK